MCYEKENFFSVFVDVYVSSCSAVGSSSCLLYTSPYVDRDLNLFMDKTEITLDTATAGAGIRYTLDGSEPTESSPIYEKPFELDKPCLLYTSRCV